MATTAACSSGCASAWTARSQGRETPIGFLPQTKDLDLTGLNWKDEYIEELLTVHVDEWQAEVPDIEKFFATFGDRLPERLKQQLRKMQARVGQ